MLIASRVIDKHSELSGLSSDDHSQYLHTTIQRTVTACHEFRSNGFGVPIVIKRLLGQTANLLNIYDDSYALLSYIDKDGNIVGTSFTGNVDGSHITGSISTSALPAAIAYENESNLFTVGNQQITIDANTKKGLTIKAAALQGASLLNIIDSNDNALFTVGAGGETLIRSSTLSNVFTIRNSLNTTYIRFDNTNDDATPRGRLTLNSGSTNKLYLYTDGTDNFVRSDGDLKFNFNDNQRFIFDQSGNLTASGVYYGSGAGLTNIQLSQLSDILIDTPASGQVLKYNSSNNKWENGTSNTLITHTHPISDIINLQSTLDAKASGVHYHSGNDITSGTVGTIYGGTGLSSYAVGDIIYASGVNSLTTLSGNGTATQKVLRMVNGTPSWIDFTLSNLNDAVTLNNYALLASSNTFTAQNTFAAGTFTQSSGIHTCLAITPTYYQSGTAGSTDIQINRVETTLGSGNHRLIDCYNGVSGINNCFYVEPRWIKSGTTYTGMLFNATDDASAAASLLCDYQVGGVSKFKVDKTGKLYSPGSTAWNLLGDSSALSITTSNWSDNPAPLVVGHYGCNIGATASLTKITGYSIPINLTTSADNVFASGVVISRTYNQYGTAGGTDLKIIRTETAASGTHRFIDCYAGAAGTTNIFSLANNGLIRLGSGGASSLQIFPFLGTAYSTANADGLGLGFWSNPAGTSSNQAYSFGGDTATNGTGVSAIHLRAIRTFAPTTGAGTFTLCNLSYTVNQTGGSNGAVIGLRIDANETAVGGINRLIDCYTGPSATNNVFRVSNSGVITSKSLLTGDRLIISNSAGTSFASINNGNSDETPIWYFKGNGNNYLCLHDTGKLRFQTNFTITYGASNYQLVKFSNTETLFENKTTTTGATKLVVRAGVGQSTTNLTEWQNNSGTVLASISPSGTLSTKGIITNLVAATGNYTLTATDNVVTTSGTLTITLPTAVGATGQTYTIKKIDTGTTLTINTTSSQTIDGVTSLSINAQWTSTTVVSDGANWLII